ncbi:hypothetical protein EJ02DRAFT_458956, partial [Clathrospora elynae]
MADETASSNGGCTLTREELMGTTKLAAQEWRFINPELWDDDVEAPDDEVDATAATTYIARAIADYTDRPTADEELFGEFCQDFKGWNKVMFRRANDTYIKELKQILRFKGVYTGRANMAPVEAVVRLLNREECPQWPDKQFKHTNFDERSVAYRLQRELKQGHNAAGPVQPTDAEQSSRARNQAFATARDQASPTARDQASPTARDQAYPTARDQNRFRAQSSQQLEQEQEQRIASQPTDTIEHTPQPEQQRQQRPSTYNNFDRFCKYTPAYPQRPKGPSLPPIETSGETDPYKAIPPIDFSNEKLDATTINTFVKMWDRDKKYTGKPYDLLDDKLKIFYSICYHADIGPGQFHAVFPQILDGRAEEYYLHFVDQRIDTFLTAYTKLKNH